MIPDLRDFDEINKDIQQGIPISTVDKFIHENSPAGAIEQAYFSLGLCNLIADCYQAGANQFQANLSKAVRTDFQISPDVGVLLIAPPDNWEKVLEFLQELKTPPDAAINQFVQDIIKAIKSRPDLMQDAEV